jgi:deazaflavin-dependent oxidoreductase (nitroreductase family)
MKQRHNFFMRMFWQLHIWLYEASGGRLGTRLAGMPVLMLHTVGRRSGKPRKNILTCVPAGDAYVVAASNAGSDRHPAWWLNLSENKIARLQVAGRTMDVKVRELSGAEREKYWLLFLESDLDYADYEKSTERLIPVVMLEPVKDN